MTLDGAAAAAPPALAEAMRYAVLDGGKRVRPALCLLTAEAVGGRARRRCRRRWPVN